MSKIRNGSAEAGWGTSSAAARRKGNRTRPTVFSFKVAGFLDQNSLTPPTAVAAIAALVTVAIVVAIAAVAAAVAHPTIH